MAAKEKNSFFSKHKTKPESSDHPANGMAHGREMPQHDGGMMHDHEMAQPGDGMAPDHEMAHHSNGIAHDHEMAHHSNGMAPDHEMAHHSNGMAHHDHNADQHSHSNIEPSHRIVVQDVFGAEMYADGYLIATSYEDALVQGVAVAESVMAKATGDFIVWKLYTRAEDTLIASGVIPTESHQMADEHHEHHEPHALAS